MTPDPNHASAAIGRIRDEEDSDSDSDHDDASGMDRHGYGGRMGLTRHGQVLPSFEATTLPPEKRTTNTPTKLHQHQQPTKADKVLSAKNSLRNILVHSLADDHDDFIHEYDAAAASSSAVAKGNIALTHSHQYHFNHISHPSNPTIFSHQRQLRPPQPQQQLR